MLRKGIKMLSHRSMSGRRLSTVSASGWPAGQPVAGLTVSDLKRVNLPHTQSEKVEAAVDASHFVLAALIALKTPRQELNLEIEQRLVRGLIQFHPRLTPISLQALEWLHEYLHFDLESVDKARLVRTLIEYGDHQLIRSAVDFLEKARGGPIPNSAIMALVRFSKDRNAVESCKRLWEYVRHNYPLVFAEYTAIMVDLMEVFARSRAYSELARDVARACMANVHNHGIALSIAKVCYRLGDEQLARELLATPGLKVSKRIAATLLQLETKTGSTFANRHTAARPDLTAQEFSGIVKSVAERSVEEAEHLVQSLQDEPGAAGREVSRSSNKKGRQTTNGLQGLNNLQELDESQRSLLAQIALCNQYIHNGSMPEFISALDGIHNAAGSGGVTGILLNLKLKWELLHGSFKHAKRHYQNFDYIPPKQRALALNTLSSLAADETDRLWVATERRRLEARHPKK